MYKIERGDIETLYNIGEELKKMKNKWIFIHAKEFQTQNVIRVQGAVFHVKIGDRYVRIEFDDHTAIYIEDKKVAYVSERISTDMIYDKVWIHEE